MMVKADVDAVVDAVGVPEASAKCSVAGVLFTYRCTIACRHCCFGCGTERPDVSMTPSQCVEALGMLHETGRVVHIAGGEAMMYWDVLAEAVGLAHEQGLAPHFIETNCSFAVDDRVVRKRLRFLADHGVVGLYASAEPFHQEHVPPERFLRVRRFGREIFGERNFFGSGVSDEEILALSGAVADPERCRAYVRRHPPVMVGTARTALALYLDQYVPDDPGLPAGGWRGRVVEPGCGRQFRADTMWEFHIDPYGNIQTNCGIILGNVADTSPAELLAAGPEKVHRFVRTVSEAGAAGLARLAEREHGFVLPERVSQTCELCYDARRFLRPHYPDVFGPAEVYA